MEREELDHLIRALARGEIRPLARLLLLFANPAAMRRTLRQVDHDLNRLFRGAHADVWGSEAIRAAELEALVSSFFGGSGRQRRHYDLHSAMRPSRLPQFAICPWREDQQAPAEALARLQGLTGDRPASATRSIDDIRNALLAQARAEHGPQAQLSPRDNDTMDLLGLLYRQIQAHMRSDTSANELLAQLQLLAAHARDPYEGPRKIVVAMGAMFDRAALGEEA